jgi:hypothetical protein
VFLRVATGASIIRKTIASDAARYKGIVRLAQDANVGDTTVKVDSIFTQLVPSTSSEVPVVDANPPGVVSLMPTALARLTYPQFFIDVERWYYFPSALTPRTVEIGPGRAHDDGRRMIGTDGELHAAQDSDFANGKVWVGINHNGSLPLVAMPAVNVSASALSVGIPVQVNNRGYVYVQTLNPVPAPGSTVVSFRSQGKWYTLADDGSGALVGDAGVGSGLVNFQTGSVSVSLGAQPDVGSAVIFNWGAPAHYEVRTGQVPSDALKLRLVLAQPSCAPGTFSVKYTSGGTQRTVSSDANGVLSGAATGKVDNALGECVMYPKYLPDPGTSVLVSYTGGEGEQETFTPTKSAGFCQVQLTNYPVTPGTLSLTYTGTAVGYRYQFTRTRVMKDNGSGGLLDEQGNTVAGGVINYSTGLVTFPPDFNAYVPTEVRDDFATVIPGRTVSTATGKYEPAVGPSKSWIVSVENAAKLVPWIDGTPVTVNYRVGTSEATSVVDEAHPVSVNGLTIDLVPGVGNTVVPNSLLFVLDQAPGWNSVDWYYERNGIVYRNMNTSTGAGTACGTIDYNTGRVKLTDWAPRSVNAPTTSVQSITVKALLTQIAPVPLAMLYGRAPGSPLRPGTFYVQALRFRDNAVISATADNNGNITSSAMHGSVDVNSGVFIVSFGAYVLDSTLTDDDKAEGWYNASAVDSDGYIWRPDEVIPGSVKFNCVVEVSLPLDPAIIKVNPVRLPPDGRVPVIRAGDTLVIADEQPYTMPSGLTAGQTVALPRSGLASVALYDANGLGVDASKFTANLATGVVTMASPLDLSAYVQPLVALHAIEDMALCTDAQITGDLSLGNALTHAYTAENSTCSSALVLGDAQARYSYLFAQNTWTNVWSDALVGSAPTGGAKFNDGLWPVELKNADTITQRWRINFTSATAYQVVGETLGVIATGTTAADCAPVNPATGNPYFILRAAGFGSGWATGNQLRFDTIAAGSPVWCARTVIAGPATVNDDRARIGVRWDKD